LLFCKCSRLATTIVIEYQMRCHPAQAFGAGPSDIQQAKFKSLGPAPEAARDDTPAAIHTLATIHTFTTFQLYSHSLNSSK